MNCLNQIPVSGSVSGRPNLKYKAEELMNIMGGLSHPSELPLTYWEDSWNLGGVPA